MAWLNKARPSPPAPPGVTTASPAPVAAIAAPRNVRASPGLKEFLWLLSDVKQGRLLDLGPVWQSTVTFFADRGFRVTTEDFLRAHKEFLDRQAERLRT